MAKKRKKNKKISNKHDEEELVNIDYVMWLFIGFFIWFALLNSAHTLVMNDKATTFFIYIGLVVFVSTFIIVKPLIKKDGIFCRRYERWNFFAYFTPLPLFIVGMSLVIILPISNMVIPYWLHKIDAHNEQIQFKIIKKREHTVCPGVDEADKDIRLTGCYDVKDICIKNRQFKKYQFCTAILLEEDWKHVQKGDAIILKGEISFLGIEPTAYVLLGN